MKIEPGGLRAGLFYTSKDGIVWGRHILFLASHRKNHEAGFTLKIGDWK